MTRLMSFHGKPELKQKLLVQLQAHYDADEIVKGKYWEDGKGCAVGCCLHSGDHESGETLWGLPKWLWRLIDTIFEGLPNDKAKLWPMRFNEAIKVGSDLSRVKYKFCSFLMTENIERVEKLELAVELKDQVISAITTVKKLHDEAAVSGVWDDEAAESASDAAWSAASAANAASAASATWSAASATWSAANAAESAANAAESAANAAWSAANAAESAAYEVYADKLIELLEAA